MSMLYEKDIRKQVLSEVQRNFPLFPARIEGLGDDEPGFAVGVFAVPREQVSAVEEFVLQLEEKFSSGAQSDLMIIALVRNREITKEYYPGLAAEAELDSILASVASCPVNSDNYSPAYTDVPAVAADEQYALAA